jgi:MoaA/NifB/PqqE/SkfB family radical SAM enzyme
LRLAETVVGRRLNRAALLHPSHLVLLVTERCNGRCTMCGHWRAEPQQPELTVPEISRLVRAKHLQQVMVVGLSGGEPFLRRDLVEIAAVCCQSLPLLTELRFSTNGSLPGATAKQIATIMASSSVDLTVTVSVDGDRATHDALRGTRGSYDRALETVRTLRSLDGSAHRLALAIRFTMQPDNLHLLLETYRLSRRLGVSFCVKPATSGGSYGSAALDHAGWLERLPAAERRHLIDAIQTIAADQAAELDGSSLLDRFRSAASAWFVHRSAHFIDDPSRPPFPCYASFGTTVIGPTGDVRDCAVLYRKMGSLRDRPFDQIWTSAAMQEARQSIRVGRCACYTYCNQMLSMLVAEWPAIMRVLLTRRIDGR